MMESKNIGFVYDDGGRSRYFRAKNVGDCAVRAIAIATGKDYKEVYDAMAELNGRTCRNGTKKSTAKAYLADLGWEWHPTMGIGTGCSCHPGDFSGRAGAYVLRLSKHLTCVKDGMIHDTYDCTRGGERCVYGYWSKK